MRNLVTHIKKTLIIFLILSLWAEAQNNNDFPIPEGTQIVHFPVIRHSQKTSQEVREVLNNEEMASRSQWDILQLIRQHPEALVFEEELPIKNFRFHTKGLRFYTHKNFVESLEDIYGKNSDISPQKILDNIRQATSFEELNEASRQVLRYNGGSKIALLLGIVKHVYPGTLLSSIKEIKSLYEEGFDQKEVLEHKYAIKVKKQWIVERYLKAKLLNVQRDLLKKEFRHLYDQEYSVIQYMLKDGFVDYKRDLLRDIVTQVLKENPNRMVIINYGAAHDLSHIFEDYNFYRIPDSHLSIPKPPPLGYIYLNYYIWKETKDLSKKEALSQLLHQILENQPNPDDFLRPLSLFDPVFSSEEKLKKVLSGQTQLWEIEFEKWLVKVIELRLKDRSKDSCQKTFRELE